MTERLHEVLGFTGSIIAVSSATTSFSRPMNVEGVDDVLFVLGMGTALGGVNSSVTLRQAASVTACESTASAAVTGATALLGSTVANSIVSAVEALITITTATTDGEILSINAVQFTQSTAGAAATVTTGFGSTAGATGADGAAPIITNLTSKINNSTFAAHQGITAETLTTDTLRIYVDDTASTTVNCTSTAASPISAAYLSQIAYISMSVDMLNSTSLYVCAQLTSATTAVSVGVATIKNKVYWNPPPAHGAVTVVKAT